MLKGAVTFVKGCSLEGGMVGRIERERERERE
jgi:hypothetical protein